jgi:1-aminocyclopropane-1-carboxylate deaminase/D-cysteine desulfhydrase-like pyridoxal-dependent ACC family enzyme
MSTFFTHIYHSTSSGGTQAGFEAGKRIFGMEHLIINGISADTSASDMAAKVMAIANPFLENLGCKNLIGSQEVNTYTDFIGTGYGIPTAGSERAKELFLEHEGILLDDTYTAKAADGLISHCESGMFRKTDKVLFWHTGGLISLF